MGATLTLHMQTRFLRHRARRKRFFYLLSLLLGGALLVFVLALLLDLPSQEKVDATLVRPTSRILDRNGRLLYEVIDPGAGKQIDLSLDSIPPACVQATLATEDSRFYLHPGVDPLAIGRAVWQSLAAREIVSGASTLTQQLARTLLMEPDARYQRTLTRKLREARLALQLELLYSKDELLALYLNQTYYGNWSFGLEAAAQTFFGKPARQLSRGECALLAGLIQHPTGYNPLTAPDVAKARQLTVLRLMREAGFVTPSEAQAIAAEPLQYRSRLFEIDAPHFVMYVQDQLADRLGIARLRAGGLTVTTTLDLALQEEAEAAVRRRLDQLNCRAPGVCDQRTDPGRRVENAAAVVLDSRSGDILAMVGSPDYFDDRIQGNVNGALSLRQPGSAVKPFTYAAAMDPHWSARVGLPPLTPATIIADLPVTYYVTDDSGGNVPYVPLNYDRTFHGPVSVRTALANSYNIPAVKTVDRIGVEMLQAIAAQAGISTFTGEFGLALTLGGGEVSLLELTAAYGIFDDGRRLAPMAIRRVEASTGGEPLLPSVAAAAGDAVITPQTAYLITDILADNRARAAAFGPTSVLDLPFAAAAKTGTTTDWRDNWTMGYSTQRVVGVWVGNADNTPMLDVSGIDGAGPIWRDIMLAAHPHTPAAFAEPDGLEQVLLCIPSGMLPSPACPRLAEEIFIAGTAPVDVDNQFVLLDTAPDTESVPQSPSGRRQPDRIVWQLPAEYHDWMRSQGLWDSTDLSSAGAATDIETRAASSADGVVPSPADPSVRSQQAEPSAPAGAVALLLLDEPTSNTAYALHPGVPAQRQRLRVSGRTGDGSAWASLRLIKDGAVLIDVHDADRLQGWWPLAAGVHRFHLEGEPNTGAATIRGPEALVVVEEITTP